MIEVEKWAYPTDEEGGEFEMIETQECKGEVTALAIVEQWLEEGWMVKWYRRS